MSEAHDDFEAEAQPGLPERLPDGEVIIWQGQPDAGQLARHAFHVRKVAAYFVLLAVWEVASAGHDGQSLAATLSGLVNLGTMALLALGLLYLLAWWSAREAIYTLTNRRVVMRFGMALRLTLNLPFGEIDGAALRPRGGGYGDISLQLNAERRISYAVLWPHARAWRLRCPEPSLRGLPDAEKVARLLADQLATGAVRVRQPGGAGALAAT